MKKYQHFNTLILREGNGIKVIRQGPKYDFYEGSLMLETDEDIVDFYQDDDSLVYYTTKKRIIATCLEPCHHPCVFIDGEPNDNYERRPISANAHQHKVLKVDVQDVIIGYFWLVYYDTTFHMICHERVVSSGLCNITCFIEEDYKFLSLGVYHLALPFNSKKIISVNIKHKNADTPPVKCISEEYLVRDYFKMACGDLEYMLCDLGNGDCYVLTYMLFSVGRTGLEWHYICAGDHKLTTQNLLLRSFEDEKSNKCVTFVMIKEDTYYYNPKTYDFDVAEDRAIGPVSKALGEAGLQIDGITSLSVVYDGTPIAGSDVHMTVHMIEGEFQSDFYQGSDRMYFINGRGRPWAHSDGFTVVVDGDEIIVYTPHNITDLDLHNDSELHAYVLPNFPEPIKSISICEFGPRVILFSEENVYSVLLLAHKTEEGVCEYTYHLGEIDFTRYKNKISKELVLYEDIDDERNEIDCSVDDENHLGQLIKLCSCLSRDYRINIEIVEEDPSLIKTPGYEARIRFISQALKQFSDLYLEERGRWPSLKSNITTLEKKELWRLGATLRMIIDLMQGPLLICLPLVIIEAIYSKAFTASDFEYFAKEQDADAFNKLDKASFMELQTGHASYEEAVRDMCGYPVASFLGEDVEKAIISAAFEIGVGFLNHRAVKNLQKMNPSTLDYYLSGSYVIDRELLCSRIEVFALEPGCEEFYDNEMRKLIMSLSEMELIQLLVNWTGSPVLEKEYTVSVSDDCNFDFETCFCGVTIPTMYFCQLRSELKEMLVTPLLRMDY